MAHILAVDDDAEVLGTLDRVLRRENLTVTLAASGSEALAILQTTQPDLLILDILMPGIDGIEVCRRVRQIPHLVALPILFLTAKGGTDDIVLGLDMGGDDYVVKPFELEELRARVQALLRRGQRGQNRALRLQAGNLLLDVANFQVFIGSEAIQLTATECRLLRYLMENVQQTLTLANLLHAVWDYPPDVGDPDLVRAHMRNLRLKIEKDPDYHYIHTVHGAGYLFAALPVGAEPPNS